MRDSNVGRPNTGTTYLSRDQRVQALLDATSELITEVGIAEVNLTAIAHRSGVTRQWLYEFFPDIDTIFASLYQSARIKYIKAYTPPPTIAAERGDYLKSMISSYLNMPVACAIVGAYAINGGLRDSRTAKLLKDSIFSNLDHTWVRPRIEDGELREEIYASVVAFMNCLFGLIVAVNDGLTTRVVAERRLERVIEAVMTSGGG